MQRMQKTIPSKPPPSMDIGEAITPPILRATEERLAGQADLKPTAVKTKPIRRLDFGMKETSARSTTLVARDSSDHTSPSLSSEESQPDSPPSSLCIGASVDVSQTHDQLHFRRAASVDLRHLVPPQGDTDGQQEGAASTDKMDRQTRRRMRFSKDVMWEMAAAREALNYSPPNSRDGSPKANRRDKNQGNDLLVMSRRTKAVTPQPQRSGSVRVVSTTPSTARGLNDAVPPAAAKYAAPSQTRHADLLSDIRPPRHGLLSRFMWRSRRVQPGSALEEERGSPFLLRGSPLLLRGSPLLNRKSERLRVQRLDAAPQEPFKSREDHRKEVARARRTSRGMKEEARPLDGTVASAEAAARPALDVTRMAIGSGTHPDADVPRRSMRRQASVGEEAAAEAEAATLAAAALAPPPPALDVTLMAVGSGAHESDVPRRSMRRQASVGEEAEAEAQAATLAAAAHAAALDERRGTRHRR